MTRFIVWNGPTPYVGTDSVSEVFAFARAGHSIAVVIDPQYLQPLVGLLGSVRDTLEMRLRRREWRRARLAIDPTCAYCGRDLTESDATVDHVIPKGDGGPDSEDNWELACAGCNKRKAARSLDEFCAELAGTRALRQWLTSREAKAA